jgi:hypothetical protein
LVIVVYSSGFFAFNTRSIACVSHSPDSIVIVFVPRSVRIVLISIDIIIIIE